ncbi:Prefoldin, alpha subunit [Phytophthora palmivora]|uniref:Prefoldin, alpha subunit n=1 Tax=Phytophthora palmivora TaxID=4796 RepID=A0A2P4Y995_9STRA|nr:Prefoldin, alpha subunit [Phytophthora palmivora]
MMAEAANARLLQERIESVREQLTELQNQVDRYDEVANTLVELPKRLSHKVMVPLGKRAMVPGKIVRSNEVLAHLGDDYFSWRSTPQTIEIIERKKKALCKQIETQEENLRELETKKTDIGSVAQLQKVYEDENIREIQETEEESEIGPVPRATDEDIKEYFEMEEEERLKQEQASWSWDEMMKRMEDLEAREAAGENVENQDKKQEESVEAEAAALKAKGNDAFARRRFQAAAQYYSQAIELDPTSHILYGNRAAAYHRLKKYKLALEDSDVAVSLHEPWVKGHYRRGCALAALEQYDEAADSFERAMELCPTDNKLGEKAKQMREKAKAKATGDTNVTQEAVSKTKQAPTPSITEPTSAASPSLKPPAPAASSSSFVSATSASSAFSGSIVEHEAKDTPIPVPAPVASPFSEPRQSRFHGTNYTGQTVTLEPVGEAQPVKRVSRFKAARAARGSN